MSEENHKKIVAFVNEELARGEHRTLTSLELVSAPPNSRGSSLQTWDRTSDPEAFGGQAQIECLASKILEIAEGFARDLGGVQRFELKTIQHMGGKRKMSFRVEDDLDVGGGDEVAMTDAPNAQGLTSQLMRHLELKERTMLQMFQASLGTMSRTINDLSAENHKLRSERAAHFSELEANRSLQAQRDLELLERDALVRRKDQLFGEITKLLPVVASRFATGGGDAPAVAESAALRALLGQFGSSLTDEQKAKIATMLTPAQGMMLMEAFRVAEQTNDKQTS